MASTAPTATCRSPTWATAQWRRSTSSRRPVQAAGGQNFGWRIREGDIVTPGIGDADPGGLAKPVLAYGRSFGGTVTGGCVMRQADAPLIGQYVFADLGSGRVWAIDDDGSLQTMAAATELTAALNGRAAGPHGSIASFGERVPMASCSSLITAARWSRWCRNPLALRYWWAAACCLLALLQRRRGEGSGLEPPSPRATRPNLERAGPADATAGDAATLTAAANEPGRRIGQG